ncbi:MAG: hypothetical protein JO051_13430, partial [Acidobacteriaceae bacterium]|nr:hypothetical protein [Acidobacteriaceae bacterium]
MQSRTIEDRLREEYFQLLPEVRRVAEYLEAVTRYQLRSLSRELDSFEQVIIKSRIKDCESAVGSLRRRQEGAIFYPDRAKTYSLTNLRDLAGVRVLGFPSRRLKQIDAALQNRFKSWTADPVLEERPAGSAAKARRKKLALKYWGF